MSSAGCASIGCTGRCSATAKRASPAAPSVERGAGDGTEIAGEHQRARRTSATGSAGRGSDRIDHHAFERALAQFADEQAQQEVLLGRGGTLEQRLAAARHALAAEPLPVVAAMRASVASTSRKRERRLRAGGAAQRPAQRGIADAEPTLTHLAGKVGDRDLDFVGGGAAQAVRRWRRAWRAGWPSTRRAPMRR